MIARAIEDWQVAAPEGAPGNALVVAPPDVESIAAVLEWASLEGRRVLPWGGGTHMLPGAGSGAEVIVLTRELDRVVDWQPEDLTLVVEGGASAAAVEDLLAASNQSPVLTERSGGSTIGGLIASGSSGYRRLRYGPTRDRVLEATVATGDGRVITAGGRVVKNVTGYDIPRLMTGSIGSLGIIGRVCLKLWPVPGAAATLTVDVESFRSLYRPLALLETESGASAYIAGTAEEVEAQARAVGANATAGLTWPEPLREPNRIELRVPSPLVSKAVTEVRKAGATRFRAQHGVGIVSAGFSDWSNERLASLRKWAETNGGYAVVLGATETAVDPWGKPPQSTVLQRRIKEAFDPRRVMVPGALPGGV